MIFHSFLTIQNEQIDSESMRRQKKMSKRLSIEHKRKNLSLYLLFSLHFKYMMYLDNQSSRVFPIFKKLFLKSKLRAKTKTSGKKINFFEKNPEYIENIKYTAYPYRWCKVQLLSTEVVLPVLNGSSVCPLPSSREVSLQSSRAWV